MGILPFTYLGCSVLYGRRRVVHYEELLRKIVRRIGSWHNKFLTFRGKLILVKHVLHSMPLYLLSVLNPPKKVFYRINKIFAFFSGVKWVELKKSTGLNGRIYAGQRGRGIALWSFNDISRVLFSKLWWIFRSSTNLIWSHYMWNKYCKKDHPCIVIAGGGGGLPSMEKKCLMLRKKWSMKWHGT